jgi:hypothetical protein
MVAIFYLGRPEGIEPSLPDPQTGALPLSYERHGCYKIIAE